MEVNWKVEKIGSSAETWFIISNRNFWSSGKLFL